MDASRANSASQTDTGGPSDTGGRQPKSAQLSSLSSPRSTATSSGVGIQDDWRHADGHNGGHDEDGSRLGTREDRGSEYGARSKICLIPCLINASNTSKHKADGDCDPDESLRQQIGGGFSGWQSSAIGAQVHGVNGAARVQGKYGVGNINVSDTGPLAVAGKEVASDDIPPHRWTDHNSDGKGEKHHEKDRRMGNLTTTPTKRKAEQKHCRGDTGYGEIGSSGSGSSPIQQLFKAVQIGIEGLRSKRHRFEDHTITLPSLRSHETGSRDGCGRDPCTFSNSVPISSSSPSTVVLSTTKSELSSSSAASFGRAPFHRHDVPAVRLAFAEADTVPARTLNSPFSIDLKYTHTPIRSSSRSHCVKFRDKNFGDGLLGESCGSDDYGYGAANGHSSTADVVCPVLGSGCAEGVHACTCGTNTLSPSKVSPSQRTAHFGEHASSAYGLGGGTGMERAWPPDSWPPTPSPLALRRPHVCVSPAFWGL